jgi:hypothetical protein
MIKCEFNKSKDARIVKKRAIIWAYCIWNLISNNQRDGMNKIIYSAKKDSYILKYHDNSNKRQSMFFDLTDETQFQRFFESNLMIFRNINVNSFLPWYTKTFLSRKANIFMPRFMDYLKYQITFQRGKNLVSKTLSVLSIERTHCHVKTFRMNHMVDLLCLPLLPTTSYKEHFSFLSFQAYSKKYNTSYNLAYEDNFQTHSSSSIPKSPENYHLELVLINEHSSLYEQNKRTCEQLFDVNREDNIINCTWLAKSMFFNFHQHALQTLDFSTVHMRDYLSTAFDFQNLILIANTMFRDNDKNDNDDLDALRIGIAAQYDITLNDDYLKEDEESLNMFNIIQQSRKDDFFSRPFERQYKSKRYHILKSRTNTAATATASLVPSKSISNTSGKSRSRSNSASATLASSRSRSRSNSASAILMPSKSVNIDSATVIPSRSTSSNTATLRTSTKSRSKKRILPYYSNKENIAVNV